MRRLVWRSREDEDWKTYGINRMYIGDKPAAAGLEVAKKKVGELGKEIDNETADIITRGYVDDGLGGGRDHVVRKLIGVEYFNTEDEQSRPTPYLGVQESKAIAITPSKEVQESKAAYPKTEGFSVPPEITGFCTSLADVKKGNIIRR